MAAEITYADRIGSMLWAMKINEVFILAENVKTSNRKEFIQIAKSYIDRGFGRRWGWEIMFSPDYSKIKKCKI